MLSNHHLFKQDYIKEDLGTTAAIGGIGAAIVAVFSILRTHRKANEIENNLLKHYEDDFLTLEIDSNISVNDLFSLFTVRGKLLGRMVSKNQLVLVNNMATAKLLKQYFGEYPMFKHLFTAKKLFYPLGKDFFTKHTKLLELFGALRSDSAITWDGILKSFATLGLSQKINDEQMTDAVQANLYYLALLLRQLLLHKNEIRNIQLNFKRIEIRH
jgi:hypothetical protein